MVVALIGVIVFGSTSAAQAAQFGVAPPAASVMIPQAGGLCANDSAIIGDNARNFLAVERWASATGNIHTHLDNALFKEQDKVMARESISSGLFSSANAMWSVTSSLTDFSIRYCAFDTIAQQVDGVVAKLGEAIGKSGLITLFIVITIVSVAWKMRKGGFSGWGSLVSKLGIVALLSVMIMGATAGAEKTKIPVFNPASPIPLATMEAYVPGFLSPGWIVTTLNSSLTSMASLPAAALMELGAMDRQPSTKNALHCDNYLDAMDVGYREAMGDGLNKISASVPLSISNLWETSVLKSWQGGQYGTDAIPGGKGLYSDAAYCHQLDWYSKTPITVAKENWNTPSTTGVLSRVLGKSGKPSEESIAFVLKTLGEGANNTKVNQGEVRPSKALQPVDNENTDRSIMAWAQCEVPPQGSSFNISEAFKNQYEGNDPSPEDCMTWWTSKDKVPGSFDYDQNPSKVAEKSETAAFANFINTVHGYEVWEAMGIGLILNLSSFIMMLVFGTLAVSVLLAKTLLAFVGLGIFISVIAAFMPGKGFEQVKKTILLAIGIIFLVIFAQLFFSIIVAFTTILIGVGNAFIPMGSVAAIMWGALAPALVIAGLIFIFKKLKLPNPLSLKSGMAWGQKLAGSGGSAAMGAGGLGRMARMAQRRAFGRSQTKSLSRAINGGGRGKPSIAKNRTGSQAGKLIQKDTSLGDDGTGLNPGEEGSQATPGKTAAVASLEQQSLRRANSQASQLARTSSERKILKKNAKEERIEAAEWQKQQRAEIDEAAGRKTATRRDRFKNLRQDGYSDLRQKFRENPIGMAKKTALTAGIAGAAVLAAPVAFPVAAVAGAAALGALPIAGRGMSHARTALAARGMTLGNRAGRGRMDDIVDDYRRSAAGKERMKGNPGGGKKPAEKTTEPDILNGTDSGEGKNQIEPQQPAASPAGAQGSLIDADVSLDTPSMPVVGDPLTRHPMDEPLPPLPELSDEEVHQREQQEIEEYDREKERAAQAGQIAQNEAAELDRRQHRATRDQGCDSLPELPINRGQQADPAKQQLSTQRRIARDQGHSRLPELPITPAQQSGSEGTNPRSPRGNRGRSTGNGDILDGR